MADFFRSAFDYLNNATTSQDNDFVGQYVELGTQKLRVKSVIAEGIIFIYDHILINFQLLYFFIFI